MGFNNNDTLKFFGYKMMQRSDARQRIRMTGFRTGQERKGVELNAVEENKIRAAPGPCPDREADSVIITVSSSVRKAKDSCPEPLISAPEGIRNYLKKKWYYRFYPE
jgi:hypothetical protein